MYVWRSCRKGRGEAGAQLATAALFPLRVEGGSAGAKKNERRRKEVALGALLLRSRPQYLFYFYFTLLLPRGEVWQKGERTREREGSRIVQHTGRHAMAVV